MCLGETAELLWSELSDDEGTYQAHDIVFDTHNKKGSAWPLNSVHRDYHASPLLLRLTIKVDKNVSFFKDRSIII